MDGLHVGRSGAVYLVQAFAVEEFLRAGYDHAIMLGSLNAASFYTRCGFVEESRGSFSIGGGLNLDHVRMRRPLRSA